MRKLDFRSKLMLSFFITSIIPLFTIVLFTSMNSSTILEQQARNTTSLTVDQIAKNLSNRFNQVNGAVQMITYSYLTTDRTINNFFNTETQKSVYEQVSDYRTLKLFLSNIETSLKLERIRLYINNSTAQSNQDDNSYSFDKLKEIPNFILPPPGTPDLKWKSTYTQSYYGGTKHQIISAYKILTKLSDASQISAVMFIDIPFEEIVNNTVDFGNYGNIFIIDNEGKLVFAKNKSLIGQTWNVPFLNKVMHSDSSDFKLNGQIFIQKPIQPSGWKVVAQIPLGTLLQQSRAVRNYTIIFSLVVLVIVILIVLLLSGNLTKRLIMLLRAMESSKQASDGEIIPQINHLSSKSTGDEVDRLIGTYNRMAERIDKLVKQVYQVKLDESLARFKALQSQINPHFLFNILNSIRGNLLEKSDIQNAEIINLLAKSFRNMLNQTDNLIRLSEEAKMVETYLLIQQFRYPNKLSFRIDIPIELQGVKLPKLTLQPIIENAVIHGIETQPNNCMISLKASVSDNVVELVVEDNGSGISQAILAKIQTSLNNNEFVQSGEHIGLANVHQRIKNMFGNEYGVKLESQAGIGTKVSVFIPLHQEGSDTHA